MASSTADHPLYKTTPFAHQLRCLAAHGRKRIFALFAEQGTGKSWIIINNAADLWNQGACDAVLVFAPNGVQTNWTRLELPAHMPDWVRWSAAAWSSQNTLAERQRLDAILRPSPTGTLRVLTMNWEALPTKRGIMVAEQFALSAKALMIVCDESDEIGSPKAQRTKALMALKRYGVWRRILTGTPINGTPFTAFSQFGFLDESILGSSYAVHKATYAEMLDKGHPLMARIIKKNPRAIFAQIVATDRNGNPKYRNLDQLHARIAPYTFRVLKKDCLDLPEKVYTTAYFNLTKEQKAIYQKAEEELRLAFEGDETPFNRLAIATKCAQITSGYYLHPMSTQPVRIEGKTPKMDLLVERVVAAIRAGQKVIVWARFQVQIQDILQALRMTPLHDELGKVKTDLDGNVQYIECVRYDGTVKKAERIEAIEAFERGSAHVFVGNQQAGGTGITLIAASLMIYFSENFRLRDRLQSEDRAHRIGQTKHVTYLNLVAKDTIDEAVVKALLNKKDVADLIVDGSLLKGST